MKNVLKIGLQELFNVAKERPYKWLTRIWYS